MREFIEFMIAQTNLKKVLQICKTTEKTLRKYLNGEEIRTSVKKKIASNIDVRVSTIGDKRIDACCGADFIFTKKDV